MHSGSWGSTGVQGRLYLVLVSAAEPDEEVDLGMLAGAVDQQADDPHGPRARKTTGKAR
jgi:hypothetical protein